MSIEVHELRFFIYLMYCIFSAEDHPMRLSIGGHSRCEIRKIE